MKKHGEWHEQGKNEDKIYGWLKGIRKPMTTAFKVCTKLKHP